MRIIAIICGSLMTLFFLSSRLSIAEFYDPMRPPPFAMKKFRLEKINIASPSKTVKKTETKVLPWVLNSILYSEHRQHAIINNKLVKKGDVIKGARLIKLGPDSVKLIARGKTIELNLSSRYQSIKRSLSERKL